MAITLFVPGFKTGKTDDRRGDGAVVRSDLGTALVIDGFDGSAPSAALIKWMKDNGCAEPDLLLTHPHFDHFVGLNMILSDSFFRVKKFFCYDPESIVHGIGSDGNGRSVARDHADLCKCIALAERAGAKVEFLEAGSEVELDDIRFRVWRKQPEEFGEFDFNNAFAFMNDGSLCCYFPELCFLTTGDGPDQLKEAVAYFGGRICFMKVPHHGNNCSMSNAQAAREAGCTLAYETNIEAGGPGTTDFTRYGSRRLVQQGVRVLMQDADILARAEDGKLTVSQGKESWIFEVPYGEYVAQN